VGTWDLPAADAYSKQNLARNGIPLTGRFYRFLKLLAYLDLMDEHRISPRHRVLKAGTIEFGGGAIDCIVRNLSAAGAALDVSSPVGIPKHFTLIADGSHTPCHVVWRRGTRIGVTFD